MTVLEMLLRYQETDMQLLRVEREINASEERKRLSRVRNFIQKAPERLDVMEEKAFGLHVTLDKLRYNYARICGELDELEKGAGDALDEQSIAYYQKKTEGVLHNLATIRNEIHKLEKTIEQSKKEYDEMKKMTIQMQKTEYPAAKAEYDKKYKEKENEIKKIRADMAEIAKDIPHGYVEKYNTKRKEKVLPVLFDIKGNNMCFCNGDLSQTELFDLDKKGIAECAHCGRLIYRSH